MIFIKKNKLMYEVKVYATQSVIFHLLCLSTNDKVRGAILEISQRKSESRTNNLFQAFVLTATTLENADSQR